MRLVHAEYYSGFAQKRTDPKFIRQKRSYNRGDISES